VRYYSERVLALSKVIKDILIDLIADLIVETFTISNSS